MVRHIIAHLDFLQEQIALVREEIDECMVPVAENVERLDGIPGVGITTAQVIMVEFWRGHDSHTPPRVHLKHRATVSDRGEDS
jgi:hypothetical protein